MLNSACLLDPQDVQQAEEDAKRHGEGPKQGPEEGRPNEALSSRSHPPLIAAEYPSEEAATLRQIPQEQENSAQRPAQRCSPHG